MRTEKWNWILSAVLLPAIVIGLVWAYAGDFPDSLEPHRWVRWAIGFAHNSSWAYVVFAILIALLSQAFVPINLLLLMAALAFPGWVGFFIGLGGAVLAALMQAELGRVIGRETLNKRFGERFEIVSGEIAANGFAAMLVMSLVPVAPAFVTNMVAGVCRVPRWKHVAGTIIGFLPGLAIMNLLSHKVRAFASDPSLKAGVWFIGVIALFFLAGSIARRCKQRLDERLRVASVQTSVPSSVSPSMSSGASTLTEA